MDLNSDVIVRAGSHECRERMGAGMRIRPAQDDVVLAVLCRGGDAVDWLVGKGTGSVHGLEIDSGAYERLRPCTDDPVDARAISEVGRNVRERGKRPQVD